MSGGWGNHIMQDEPSFLVLDASLVLVACYLLTVFHPGLFFPQMANGSIRRSKKSKKSEAHANDSSEAEAGTAPPSSNEHTPEIRSAPSGTTEQGVVTEKPT